MPTRPDVRITKHSAREVTDQVASVLVTVRGQPLRMAFERRRLDRAATCHVTDDEIGAGEEAYVPIRPQAFGLEPFVVSVAAWERLLAAR